MCPSCHQKRILLTAIHVADNVCALVAHCQVVLTIPERLILYACFDRRLLAKLSHCAWTCVQAEVRRQLGRGDVVPGMVEAVQIHGKLLRWHPHLHAILTCGAFSPAADIAYGSGRPRTGPAAWPGPAFLEATVAHRTADVVDNTAFFVVD